MPMTEKIVHYKKWYKSHCCNSKGQCKIRGMCYDYLKNIFANNMGLKNFIDTKCYKKFFHRSDEYKTYCNLNDIDEM